MKELKKRSEMDPQYCWDLTKMYADDEAFKKALKDIDEDVASVEKFRSSLKDAGSIRAFLDAYVALMRKMRHLSEYAMLRKSEDTADPDAGVLNGMAMAKGAQVAAAVSFAEPEILSLSEETLDEIVNADQLKDYQVMLKNMIRKKKYTLSDKEEALLAAMNETLMNPYITASTLMDADLKFADVNDSEGNVYPLSGSNYMLLQRSKDRTLRKNAFLASYEAYKNHANTFAATLNGAVKANVTEASIRGYASSRMMKMDSDDIPEAVYDNLIDTVHDRMDVMYRYLKLRKRLMKLDELHYYDTYVSFIEESTKSYTFDEAEQIVRNTLSVMGDEYMTEVDKAFRERWIDIYPNKGKSGGAFSSGSYDSVPYIMLNYNGTLMDISTLIHELGHSMHTNFTKKHQPAQYYDYTMFVAEVASTVNENLLVHYLLQNETDPKTRLSYLHQFFETAKGTIYRQTMFAEFEREIHELVENGGTLTADAGSEIYMNLIRRYFGDDLVIDEDVKYEWCKVPHFYFNFYVYVYATGFASAVAISEKILQEGAPYVEKYLQFLSSGGSMEPLEELRICGIDLATPEPINIAIDRFNEYLAEAERLADELGL